MDDPSSQATGAPGRPLPPPAPSPGPSGPRQLRRLPDQGPIAGVCAGLAQYFGVDPIIVRIAMVVLAFSGPGAIAYVLAWIFVPAAESAGVPASDRPPGREDRGMQILGIVLLVVALSVIWGDWWHPGRRLLFPVALIALGTWLLLRRGDGSDGAGGGEAAVPPSPSVVGWRAPSATAGAAAPVDDVPHDLDADLSGAAAAEQAGDDPAGDDTVVDAAPTDDVTTVGAPPWAPATPVPGEMDRTPGSAREPEASRRRRRMLAPMVMGALLIWGGIAWLAGATLVTSLAVALCIVGVGFVLGAFVGGSWALVVPAVLIGSALVATSIVDIPLSGPVGDRTWRPRTVADVRDTYAISVGEGTLDLTGLDLDVSDELEIEATVGIGHLVIEVPEGISLDLEASSGIGEVVLLDVRNSGFAVDDDRIHDAGPSTPSLRLDLQAGIGQVEVVHLPVGRVEGGSGSSTTTSVPR